MPTIERGDLGTLSEAIREAEKRGLSPEKAHGLESFIEHLVSTVELLRERIPEEPIEFRFKSYEPSGASGEPIEELVKAMEVLGISVKVERSRVFTPQEAADMLGVSKQTIINWIRDGKIRAERTPGGHFRIAVEDFSAFHDEYETFHDYRPKRAELAEMTDEELAKVIKERRRRRKSHRSGRS